MSRRTVALLLVVVTTASVLALGQAAASTTGDDGTVLRSTSGPAGARTIDYRTTSVDGTPTRARALLWVPRGAPSGHVVTWGHPTTGLADRCAPSADPTATVPGLEALLAAGHVVVAPDFEGLGAPGEHPYLVGVSAARSILDAARAARREAQVDGAVAVFGWSQGGHGALFAGREAAEYAPELDLRGVAAVAPVTEPLALLDAGSGFARYPGFVALLAAGYEAAYPELDGRALVADPDGVALARRSCALHAAASLAGTPLLEPNAEWRARLAENDATARPLEVPVLLAHGEQDRLLPVDDALRAYHRLCRGGGRVRLLRVADVGHGRINDAAVPDVLAWLDARLAGAPVSGCAHLRRAG